jgi:hypothetical protein
MNGLLGEALKRWNPGLHMQLRPTVEAEGFIFETAGAFAIAPPEAQDLVARIEALPPRDRLYVALAAVSSLVPDSCDSVDPEGKIGRTMIQTLGVASFLPERDFLNLIGELLLLGRYTVGNRVGNE